MWARCMWVSCMWVSCVWASCVCVCKLCVCVQVVCEQVVCVRRLYVSKVCVCVCVCVCVDHLHRCKTSFCLFCVLVNNFLAMYAGGQWISFHPLPNEDGGLRLWYRDWSSRRTCNFPIYRQWQPAKPSTGMSFKTVSISALLSQSGIFTLFWVLLHQNLLQSKDVESIPRTEFHDGSTNFSCQTLLDCLCTFDAFHISNSIRNFWASVSLIPLSDKVVWALRGKPF